MSLTFGTVNDGETPIIGEIQLAGAAVWLVLSNDYARVPAASYPSLPGYPTAQTIPAGTTLAVLPGEAAALIAAGAATATSAPAPPGAIGSNCAKLRAAVPAFVGPNNQRVPTSDVATTMRQLQGNGPLFQMGEFRARQGADRQVSGDDIWIYLWGDAVVAGNMVRGKLLVDPDLALQLCGAGSADYEAGNNFWGA